MRRHDGTIGQIIDGPFLKEFEKGHAYFRGWQMASNLQSSGESRGAIFMIIHLLTALAAAAVQPGAYQDLDLLDARVAEALGGPGIAAPIDRRIKLALCPNDPEVGSPAGGAVAVRCLAAGWKIRVPVSRAPASETSAQVLVHKGDAIQLVAEGSGYSASFMGIAVDEGGRDSVVRVKIPTSSSTLSAIVAGAGVATISD
jgi:flagella basal body P-ring formation protein FlgA